MIQYKYRLSTKLLGNMIFCERLYGQLEALSMPKEIWLDLKRRNQVRSSYISNSMEGNPLSLPEVSNLLLGDRVPANRDEKEVVNYFNILQSLDTWAKKPFSMETILNFHKSLMTGVNDKIAGAIRNKPIVVGKYVEDIDGKVRLHIKHNPPTHKKDKLIKLIERLIEWVNQSDEPAIIKAGVFHHHFVYLHPFEDGNGRVCRLLTALLLIKSHYLINRYFVLDDYYDVDRLAYSDALNTADRGNKTKWLEYFSDGIKYSLQSALAKGKEAIKMIKVELRPSPKEAKVLELFVEQDDIISSDVAKKFAITRQQAHHLLSSLEKKGFLEKKGSTKSSYYILKR